MLVLTLGAAFAEFDLLSARSGQWLQSLVLPAAGAAASQGVPLASEELQS